MTGRRLRVLVLAGGPSPERAISLESGAAVADALRSIGHDVVVADIGPDDLGALDWGGDVVFPALHGSFGEDGVLQGIMEERGFRFVGAGAKAAARAMDKVASKETAVELGIATPQWRVATSADGEAEPWDGGWPAVVKPADQGSSVATFLVENARELAERSREVMSGFGRALLEQYIVGDELTVGILDGRPLPPICVRAKRRFYDYEAKYSDDRTEYLFEAGFSAEQLRVLQERSVAIYRALEVRHLARVDWMMDGAGVPWFLEVNTMPGFTSHSLLPKAAARVGIGFAELCDRLVRLAAEEAE